MVFKVIFSRSMLYAWVLRNMLEIIELSMLFALVLRFFRFFLGDINAICMGFKVILRSVRYTHGFYAFFLLILALLTISHLCMGGFSYLLLYAWVSMLFLTGRCYMHGSFASV